MTNPGPELTRHLMPKDPIIREKFTRERSAARTLAKEYFERYPKDRFKTEVESWRHLQSANIEFYNEAATLADHVMKCLIC
jgi:hypothetical protein